MNTSGPRNPSYRRSNAFPSSSSGGPPPFPSARASLPASLAAVKLVAPIRATLPAEIIASILDYLPVSSLMTCARVSKRLKEMVYDDTRWVNKLVVMGVWNEAEARKRFEDALKRRKAAQLAKQQEEERKRRQSAPPGGPGARGPNGVPMGSTLFDVAEESKPKPSPLSPVSPVASSVAAQNRNQKAAEELMEEREAPITPVLKAPMEHPAQGSNPVLSILTSVRSVRGFARQEYGRVYAALGKFYYDLVRARSHTDPMVFRMFRSPEEQAIMLWQLQIFAKSDSAYGFEEREERLAGMVSIFENAALREFEGGYESNETDGRMKRYAQVLILLNGGHACVQLFVQKHYIMFERERLGNPMDCFHGSGHSSGELNMEPAGEFFGKLTDACVQQADIIDRVFPPTVNVMLPFLERVADDVVGEYVTPVLDEAHDRNLEMYVKAVASMWFETVKFSRQLRATKGSGDHFAKDVAKIFGRVFEPHVDLYLQEELDYFRRKCEEEVGVWEKKITDEYAATESFYMSNVNRQADKADFLTSFKKVILMPVNAIPLALPIPGVNISKSSSSTHTAASVHTISPTSTEPEPENPFHSANLQVSDGFSMTPTTPTRPISPGLATPSGRLTPQPATAPKTELAAKAAILNSRMEGIRSLFSIELALDLVHKGKESLERAALFVTLGGQSGEEAKEQCENIFIALVQTIGQRHVKGGFDKAVEHLSHYNPRDIQNNSGDGEQHVVQPLVQFLELVNVGDLIQQMIDVFYEQELVTAKLSDRNDFLNPAIKEKKKFEQMLDERVAAGLNTGIDVLLNEVDYILATTQKATDFNPGVTGDNTTLDVGTSETAKKVVELVSSHTKLLVGSTDKNVLDVFNQEVGMRLFASLCKHIKRQRISVDGAIVLISDINHYHSYIVTLRNSSLLQYYNALRELAQIYLIDPAHAKQMAAVIADGARFKGIFRVEEVYEYVTRRSDWYQVKKDVEKAMYGYGCSLM